MDICTDLIPNLQFDKSEPKLEEMYMINSIFNLQNKENKENIKTIFSCTKDVLIAGLLFAIFSIPIIDKFICGVFKFTTNSSILCVLLKVIIFMILLFFIQNFALSQI